MKDRLVKSRKYFTINRRVSRSTKRYPENYLISIPVVEKTLFSTMTKSKTLQKT